jgi:hypothetical protein
MSDRLIVIGRCYGMKINVEKDQGNENLRRTVSSTDYDRSETTGECGMFKNICVT